MWKLTLHILVRKVAAQNLEQWGGSASEVQKLREAKGSRRDEKKRRQRDNERKWLGADGVLEGIAGSLILGLWGYCGQICSQITEEGMYLGSEFKRRSYRRHPFNLIAWRRYGAILLGT